MKRLCTLLTLKNRSINIYATCVKSYIADDQISHIINQIPDLYIWGFCQHFKMKQGGNRMIKTLLGQVGEYKKDSILTPVFTAAEVFMEILIPFVTAKIIDEGINGQDMSKVYMYGGLMLVLAFLSLFFGVMAGKFAASASTGFACNLREGMYRNVQEFSFTNIDKFSTASLITRMTTDVTNVQNAYQMLIRVAVRAPIMMIFAMIMSFTINVKISLIFLATIPVLGFILIWLACQAR